RVGRNAGTLKRTLHVSPECLQSPDQGSVRPRRLRRQTCPFWPSCRARRRFTLACGPGRVASARAFGSPPAPDRPKQAQRRRVGGRNHARGAGVASVAAVARLLAPPTLRPDRRATPVLPAGAGAGHLGPLLRLTGPAGLLPGVSHRRIMWAAHSRLRLRWHAG